jgi:hypothetical protein
MIRNIARTLILLAGSGLVVSGAWSPAQTANAAQDTGSDVVPISKKNLPQDPVRTAIHDSVQKGINESKLDPATKQVIQNAQENPTQGPPPSTSQNNSQNNSPNTSQGNSDNNSPNTSPNTSQGNSDNNSPNTSPNTSQGNSDNNSPNTSPNTSQDNSQNNSPNISQGNSQNNSSNTPENNSPNTTPNTTPNESPNTNSSSNSNTPSSTRPNANREAKPNSPEQAPAGAPPPAIKLGIAAMQRAEASLAKAGNNWGGHKGIAIKLIDQALTVCGETPASNPEVKSNPEEEKAAMQAAVTELTNAQTFFEKATNPWDGRRDKAKPLISQALEQLQQGMNAANEQKK